MRIHCSLRAKVYLVSAVFIVLFGMLFDPRYMMLATIPTALLLGWCNRHLCDVLAAALDGCNKRGGR